MTWDVDGVVGMLMERNGLVGWKSLHGIKVETVLLPNGIRTVFGLVSARQNNRGTLNLSGGLNHFLMLIQASLLPELRCMMFGDSIFRGLLQYITTYYRAIAPNLLTAEEVKINAAFRAARMPIEKNYGLTSCLFRICDTNRGYQLESSTPLLWNSSGCVTFLWIVTSVWMGSKRAVWIHSIVLLLVLKTTCDCR